MSAQDEEDDRIDQLISAGGWCFECDAPIGQGTCLGCISVESDCECDECERGFYD